MEEHKVSDKFATFICHSLVIFMTNKTKIAEELELHYRRDKTTLLNKTRQGEHLDSLLNELASVSVMLL